ncbi:hypothetical protein NHQ30_004930 [Ciborinia camelliae]|nr:hypothetical protein NHQ30_004930 [Ciborinia camelliae]
MAVACSQVLSGSVGQGISRAFLPPRCIDNFNTCRCFSERRFGTFKLSKIIASMHLCRRRGWQGPQYKTYRDAQGFTCLVLVNGQEYQTDLAYQTDALAQENAATQAFMVCRQSSVNGGMLARNGVIQGLPANETGGRHKKRSDRQRQHSVTLSSSSSSTSSESENRDTRYPMTVGS